MSQAASNTPPINGHARIDSPLGAVTLTWATYGTVTDLFISDTEAPHDVMAKEQGLVATTAFTIQQVARGLAAQGLQVRFHVDERAGRADELARVLVKEGSFEPSTRFSQVRGKVAEGIERSATAGTVDLPEVDVYEIVSNTQAWLDLYAATLAERPQRGITTPDGARRQVDDDELPRPTFFAAIDPEDPTKLVGAVTASAVASTPGAPVIGEIAMLAVRPDWQRRGLGAKLVGTALEHLNEVGSRTAFAYMDEGNDAASALFARLGFQERSSRAYYSID